VLTAQPNSHSQSIAIPAYPVTRIHSLLIHSTPFRNEPGLNDQVSFHHYGARTRSHKDTGSHGVTDAHALSTHAHSRANDAHARFTTN